MVVVRVAAIALQMAILLADVWMLASLRDPRGHHLDQDSDESEDAGNIVRLRWREHILRGTYNARKVKASFAFFSEQGALAPVVAHLAFS